MSVSVTSVVVETDFFLWNVQWACKTVMQSHSEAEAKHLNSYPSAKVYELRCFASLCMTMGQADQRFMDTSSKLAG